MEQQNNNIMPEITVLIADILKTDISDITDIKVLKKGMTNRSFLFRCHGKRYILRIPGEGTDQLIDRAHEASVYQLLHGKGICDNNIYINSTNGYKITQYLENARVCDPLNQEDVEKCMKKLRSFHRMSFQVGHEFDLFNRIDFYESLWDGRNSAYRDYTETKRRVLSLKPYIEAHAADRMLTHIDAVPDNFLFVKEGESEKIHLIDWEYAGMQDPHVDIAMFGIYALYDRRQIDRLIQIYFDDNYTREAKIKIYCYVAVCGLLWSNWCEYKKHLGANFGEYSLRQYQYAKEYYYIVRDELEEEGEKWGIK